MRRVISSPLRQLIAGALLVAVAVIVELVVLSSSSSSPAPRHLESMFQDDDHLVYASTATVAATLNRLEHLGVDTIRVTMLWRAIAPQPNSAAEPRGFDAANPGAYPAAAWAPYDRLVELAARVGITVDFDITAPGPLWAMARGAPSARYAPQWMPSAGQFGEFVAAAGRRYSGRYTPVGTGAALPRVHYWSIWNEPNQPGWLAPQRRGSGTSTSTLAPALYRAYANAAYAALARTGHPPTRDTFLIGELAPEGCEPRAPCLYSRLNRSIPPIPFVRALYCLDAGGRPLGGSAAAALGCPRSADPSGFVAANPGLFQPTGFAHHPYSFFLGPAVSMPDPNFAPLADLGRIERELDSAFRAYGLSRRLDLYLTEYGYETNPPNPFRGVRPDVQARYLDESTYMAWRDPRVRALSQFLLYDSAPDTRFRPGTLRYWSTFQTGLLFQNGGVKPSYGSYRLPVYVPDPSGPRVLVWAMLRPAPHDTPQRAEVQWRGAGAAAFTTLARVSVQNPTGALTANVSVPGAGALRIAWRAPDGQRYYSRSVGLQGR